MNLFKKFWLFLDKKQKFLFFVLVFFSIIQTILEMIGIAAAIPFVTFLLQPEKLPEMGFITRYLEFNEIVFKTQVYFLILYLQYYDQIKIYE